MFQVRSSPDGQLAISVLLAMRSLIDAAAAIAVLLAYRLRFRLSPQQQMLLPPAVLTGLVLDSSARSMLPEQPKVL